MAGRQFVVLMTDEQIDLLLEEKLGIPPSQADPPSEGAVRAYMNSDMLPMLMEQITGRFARK